MAELFRIVGIHPFPASEPCHLVEIELRMPSDDFDFGSVTQEMPDQPQDNWQVAYDEQQIGKDEAGTRWVFFIHYLDLKRPMVTPFGPITIPAPTPLPSRLEKIEYNDP